MENPKTNKSVVQTTDKTLLKYKQPEIENRIFTIRSIQVMIDRDIAELYDVETKRLNEQVKRNMERFPEKFRFQLKEQERNELVANCDRFQNLKHSSSMPFAFTEQGVAMLSAVLKSKTAIQVSLLIIDAFVEMRKVLYKYEGLLQRMDRFELKQADHEQKFEKIFKAMASDSALPAQGIYFDGQTFEAFHFASNLIRSAKISIRLIDNYIDDSVLMMLCKRQKNVSATLYCRNVSKTLLLDLKKHNEQYPEIELKHFEKSHDRFLIIDDEKVYHIGASLKDLGKKWFAFTELSKEAVTVIEKIKGI